MMNYCTEIAGTMKQAHSLSDEMGARRKANGHDREYWRLFRKHQALARTENDLRRQAAREFAALNGWRWTEHRFLARTLARGGTHDGRWVYDELTDGWLHHCLFDHALFFREIARPYRAAAIVGQPYYTNTAIADARSIAAKIGLTLHVPPNLTASWWYPGSTRFFCFTRPKITSVQFLPEQLEATKEKS